MVTSLASKALNLDSFQLRHLTHLFSLSHLLLTIYLNNNICKGLTSIYLRSNILIEYITEELEMDAREQKGIEIAAVMKIVQKEQEWLVPSQAGNGHYRVSVEEQRCTCPDFEKRHLKCKHIYACEITLKRETAPDGTVTETKTVKVTYTQDWHNYNLAQTNEKERFIDLLANLCATIEQPIQTFGRPRLPLSDMVFAATYKVYSCFSSRRFTTDLREAQRIGAIAKAAHFNSVSNYLADTDLTTILKSLIEQSATPLKAVETDFAMDSTGFATSVYERWFDHKYGKMRDRQTWVKTHLFTGVKTNIVTAVEATAFESGDAPQLPSLLQATAKSFNVREVSADKAYSSRKNLRAIDAAGATPYIPFKSNSVSSMDTHHKQDGLWDRLFYFYSFNRQSFLEHYHKRSNVESTNSMIKAKFGASVKSKSPIAQVNEVLCKVLAHNICVLIQSFYELGIESTFCAEMSVAQKVSV